MQHAIRIGVCLLIAALPAIGLSAPSPACDEGIGATPRHDCSNCCCEPAVCACEIAPAPRVPTNEPTTPAHALAPAGLPCLAKAEVAPLAMPPAVQVQRTVCRAPFQPQNRLECLHVLQI